MTSRTQQCDPCSDRTKARHAATDTHSPAAQVHAARAYLTDCGHSLTHRTDREVIAAMDVLYVGGMAQFVIDGK